MGKAGDNQLCCLRTASGANRCCSSLMMMVSPFIMVVMVAVPAVSTAFGLERGLHIYKIRPESDEHILNHMVGPNQKNLVSNFSRQMPISQMPSKAHKLTGIIVRDFDNRFGRRLYFEPPP